MINPNGIKIDLAKVLLIGNAIANPNIPNSKVRAKSDTDRACRRVDEAAKKYLADSPTVEEKNKWALSILEAAVAIAKKEIEL